MIRVEIDYQTYKDKPFLQVYFSGAEGESFRRSFDSLAAAETWITGKIANVVHELDRADSDTVFKTRPPAREEECCGYPMHTRECPVVRPRDSFTRCRCCLALMRGSDHCPQCGCEEYEESFDCAAPPC